MMTDILYEIQKDMSDIEKQTLYFLIMSNPKLRKKILKEEKFLTITEKEELENEEKN